MSQHYTFLAYSSEENVKINSLKEKHITNGNMVFPRTREGLQPIKKRLVWNYIILRYNNTLYNYTKWFYLVHGPGVWSTKTSDVYL